MRAVNRIALGLGLAGLVAACGPARGPYPELQRLTLGMRLGLENLCTGSQSPPIRIVGAPETTATYRIRLTNVSVLWPTPREWSVAAPREKGLLPFGAIEGWAGPCPGDLQRDRYRLEVQALDAAGSRIAYGQAEETVDPVNEQAQRMWRRAGSAPPPDPTVPPDPLADPALVPRDEFPRERDLIFRQDRDPRAADPLTPGYPQR
jgi:hypothetical protein